MTTSFLDPTFLIEEGPKGFTRQLERLLGLMAFTDVVNIDGPGDKGADVIGRLAGVDWIFQAKWKKSGAVDVDAVDQAHTAMNYYGIHRAVVVTNRVHTRKAQERASALRDTGVNITLWGGSQLSALYERVPDSADPFNLHLYQENAVDASWKALGDTGEALVYLATGLGKTVVAGRVLRRFLLANPGAQVLVTAHMVELVEQLERAMWRDIPKHVPTRLLHGASKPNALPGVTFGVAPTSRDYIETGYSPKLVIVDEAHHVGETGNYATMLDLLPGAKRLGVTATPWRGDKYDIEQTFGEPVVRVSISQGMKLGYLVDVKYRVFADNIDWDFVRHASEHGYSIKDLNKRLFIAERDDAIQRRLEETWDKTTAPRAIIFCQTIEHAERMRDLIARRPGWESAATLHADLKGRDRRERLLKFRSGEVPILVAVDILNEGVDVPDVNILCFARVTHSRRIFVQQLGRGLRLRKGKTHVEVLDFVSDIRRLAEVYDMHKQVPEREIEQLSIGRNQFLFEDLHVRDLLEQWMADIGDLGNADDSVRLEFPPIKGA
ncbi:superfamily II DNA or RNA helicase [Actinoalloteichus hoggarensis]|uniref:ATP-dependent RNA helicase DbpA n=1 Tax=Actinoalloteichus hoggarensis TaxID=1470176 RepID=A0A221W8X7_9PSEU|nr:helicase-related protein [Actinoalloteichus hoggarensis]ASO22056.1 ATP-dependent RNA helicase DbpA [Actinoalloteichus hoggarensis]MBB5923862.1 superfamily II DNA or RNA helicase [Actinoalloteichus hoggarensis]